MSLILFGGDGTFNYIVNEIMKLPDQERSKFLLKFIAKGSGNDFIRTYSNSCDNVVEFKEFERSVNEENIRTIDLIKCKVADNSE